MSAVATSTDLIHAEITQFHEIASEFNKIEQSVTGLITSMFSNTPRYMQYYQNTVSNVRFIDEHISKTEITNEMVATLQRIVSFYNSYLKAALNYAKTYYEAQLQLTTNPLQNVQEAREFGEKMIQSVNSFMGAVRQMADADVAATYKNFYDDVAALKSAIKI